VRQALWVFLLAAMPGVAAAQSSQFGVRGLGYPGRPLSARALATGGAFGMFDGESSLNPAALSSVTTATAFFTGLQDFRTVENPAGSESLRESHFPQIGFVGPTKRVPLVLGVSYSSYLNRDFKLATADTVDLRGVPVPVTDTLSSRGGISEFRVAGSYRLGPRWIVGGGVHVLTGTNRLEFRRTFADPSYDVPGSQKAELSYAGVGGSVGLIREFGPRVAVALLARMDGEANEDRDSTRIAEFDLPFTFGLGIRLRAASRLELASQAVYRTWSGANSDLLSLGSAGSKNTYELSLGGEYSDPRRPFRRPLRFGVRYATLPFLLAAGEEQAHELAVSLGSGARFAQQRGGVDLSLEYNRRSTGAFSERAFLVTVGISVRP
jgi:hypothetical protein